MWQTERQAEAAAFVAVMIKVAPQAFAPSGLATRNQIQYELAQQVQASFHLDMLEALCVVAHVYGTIFPHTH